MTTDAGLSHRVPLSASALGLGAIYAALYWVATVAAFHWIRPDLEPCCSAIGQYGNGDYEWLMQAAFVVLGFGWMAASISLRRAVRDSRGAGLLRVLLMIVGGGLLVAGVWRADAVPTPADPSPEHVFHTAGVLVACGALVVFGVAAAWVLRGSVLRRQVAAHLVLALVTGALVAVAWVWPDADALGWVQRALALVVPGWLAWLGWRLVVVARRR